MVERFRVPISIFVASLVIAGSLLISKFYLDKNPDRAANTTDLISLPLLLEGDHFLGNPKAEIIIIEYSDYDCPFCGSYFQNMKKVVEEFGKNGRIVWIHRHMPFYQIHETAREKALVAECAGEIGGEEKFWEVSEVFYKNILTKTAFTPIQFALKAGVPQEPLEKCVAEEKYLPKILAQYDEAYAAGARGTPFTVIIRGEERQKIEGSLAYFELRDAIESVLEK
jgi:protein-disulfide isomerase